MNLPNPVCPPLLVVNSYRDRDSHAGFYSQITLAHLYLQAQRIVRHPWQMLHLGGEIGWLQPGEIMLWLLQESGWSWSLVSPEMRCSNLHGWNCNLQYLPMAYVMAVHSISWLLSLSRKFRATAKDKIFCSIMLDTCAILCGEAGCDDQSNLGADMCW